jgi:hypothetical protein
MIGGMTGDRKVIPKWAWALIALVVVLCCCAGCILDLIAPDQMAALSPLNW